MIHNIDLNDLSGIVFDDDKPFVIDKPPSKAILYFGLLFVMIAIVLIVSARFNLL